MLRPGMLTRIAWSVDVLALLAIGFLLSRGRFHGSVAPFLFLWAPTATPVGRWPDRRSSRSGHPGFFGAGRTYVRPSAESRVWVGEPFRASLNVAICAIAILLPGGSWAERVVETDLAMTIAFAGLMAPSLIAAVGLGWSRGRLVSTDSQRQELPSNA